MFLSAALREFQGSSMNSLAVDAPRPSERVNFAGRIDSAPPPFALVARCCVNSAQLDRSCEPPRGRKPRISERSDESEGAWEAAREIRSLKGTCWLPRRLKRRWERTEGSWDGRARRKEHRRSKAGEKRRAECN